MRTNIMWIDIPIIKKKYESVMVIYFACVKIRKRAMQAVRSKCWCKWIVLQKLQNILNARFKIKMLIEKLFQFLFETRRNRKFPFHVSRDGAPS